ncbi:MAG: hypothetical protein K2O16_19930 [Lachnospiraceae bacterium]|nr:hypothetical protein [Lachnospiraceae bacterium]MDE7334453.1 hypothetical protein [Lachnospiraceae bacterium]
MFQKTLPHAIFLFIIGTINLYMDDISKVKTVSDGYAGKLKMRGRKIEDEDLSRLSKVDSG